MQWSNFTKLDYFVLVELGENLDDNDFEQFKEKWLSLYQEGKPFTIVFDTSKVGWVNPKYALQMSEFIKDLRATEVIHGKQLMTNCFIFYNSWYIKLLLKLIFYIQKPVAPVHILKKEDFDISKYKIKNKYI